MILLLFIGQIYWLDEIVVTATRYPEELVRIPVSVSVIDQDEIEDFLELNGALSGLPGLRPLNYGFGSLSTIGIRGLPADETLVLVDGVPINSVATGVGDLSFIPTELVKQVEVVRGPGSSIYGSNAVGGIVNIVTRKDDFLKSGIGNHNYWGLHSSGAVGEFFHLNGGGAHWDGERTNDELSRYFISSGINIRRLNLNCLYAEKSFGLPGPKPGEFIPEFGDSTAGSIFDHETDRRCLPVIGFEIEPAEGILITNKTFLNYCRIHYQTYYRHYIGFPALENDQYITATLGDELQARFDLPFKNRIVIGGSYNYDTLIVNTTIDDDSLKRRFSDETWQIGSHRFGVWLEDRQAIGGLDLFGAVRYDQDKRFDPQISPSVGFSLRPTGRIRLRSHWGMAYRILTFNDLYWPNSGNPDLKPETGTGIEGGIDIFLPNDISLSLSGFNRKVADKIAWVPSGILWQPQNINKVKSIGIEVGLEGRVIEFVTYDLSYTYLDPKQINSEPISFDTLTNSYRFEERERILINTPKHSGRISLGVDLGFLRLGLATIITGTRYAYYADYFSQYPEVVYSEKEIAPSYITNLFIELSANRFSLRFGLDNLTGCRDPVQFGNSINDLDYPRPGRSFRFEVNQIL
ncbi:MAG TPA: TonB-dependent receptor [bacterium (Candidatus Stahlbacteria)]|nr:TonB-dependent receptor [Candidatus Stahlbacteria bacterium]